jgi:dTDP-4-dehydrorhamnose reductase
MLVTGSRGQLGRALARVAAAAPFELIGFDLPELDITDGVAVRATARAVRPDVIVNCAAFTSVDAAEIDEPGALAVNGTAVSHLAAAANEVSAPLVQISTDYVFDGTSRRPYREGDDPCPRNAYGRTKLTGERAAAAAARMLVVRTAWLFGESGPNFVEAIRRRLAAGEKHFEVVDDQRGCPTYALDLAEAVVGLVAAGATGIVHVVNDGDATWCGFAREIVRQLGFDVEVQPITTRQVGRPAPRPSYSVLDTSRLRALLGRTLPPWRDALARYLRATVAA